MKLNEGAKTIIGLLEKSGHKAYAVGGSIRDQVMGKEPSDFDITTDATAEEMLDIFSGYKTLTTGIKHGTVGVIINKEVFECTTFRVDGEYSDTRHPDTVRFSRSLKDDLSRRDFTVNALCYNASEGVIDMFDGIGDIERKIIRCIGEPEKRFSEDALRILRGMRFAATLNFTIDDETKAAMIKLCHLLESISRERITEEVRKMMVGSNLEYVFEALSPVFDYIFSGINLSEALIRRIVAAPEDFEYRMSLILRENRNNADIFSNFRFSKSASVNIEQLSLMKIPESKVQLKYMLNEFKEENVIRFLKLNYATKAIEWYKEIIENNECFSISGLKISGRDVLSLGYPPQEVGKILESLLDKVINDEIPNIKEELLKAVRN